MKLQNVTLPSLPIAHIGIISVLTCLGQGFLEASGTLFLSVLQCLIFSAFSWIYYLLRDINLIRNYVDRHVHVLIILDLTVEMYIGVECGTFDMFFIIFCSGFSSSTKIRSCLCFLLINFVANTKMYTSDSYWFKRHIKSLLRSMSSEMGTSSITTEFSNEEIW